MFNTLVKRKNPACLILNSCRRQIDCVALTLGDLLFYEGKNTLASARKSLLREADYFSVVIIKFTREKTFWRLREEVYLENRTTFL